MKITSFMSRSRHFLVAAGILVGAPSSAALAQPSTYQLATIPPGFTCGWTFLPSEKLRNPSGQYLTGNLEYGLTPISVCRAEDGQGMNIIPYVPATQSLNKSGSPASFVFVQPGAMSVFDGNAPDAQGRHSIVTARGPVLAIGDMRVDANGVQTHSVQLSSQDQAGAEGLLDLRPGYGSLLKVLGPAQNVLTSSMQALSTHLLGSAEDVSASGRIVRQPCAMNTCTPAELLRDSNTSFEPTEEARGRRVHTLLTTLGLMDETGRWVLLPTTAIKVHALGTVSFLKTPYNAQDTAPTGKMVQAAVTAVAQDSKIRVGTPPRPLWGVAAFPGLGRPIPRELIIK
jgi:hypothetical protein